MTLGSLLTVPAAALKVTASVLRALARTSEALAGALDGAPEARHDTSVGAPPRSRAPAPPAQPSAIVDIAALAARPARDVIAAVRSLSMEELAELHRHESRHRRRRTVLDAIDRAATPPADARGDADDKLTDDVREPDEVVYTTQTPAP